jgi:hypothetical protein
LVVGKWPVRYLDSSNTPFRWCTTRWYL